MENPYQIDYKTLIEDNNISILHLKRKQSTSLSNDKESLSLSNDKESKKIKVENTYKVENSYKRDNNYKRKLEDIFNDYILNS
jgi:hypothetical protein